MHMHSSLLGASVSRPKDIVLQHRGTCADPACLTIVDTMPETGARHIWRQDFGGPITIDSIGATEAERTLRASRALSQVGRLPYSAATCDQLTTFAETGAFYSPQAIFWTTVAAIALIWAARN